MNDVETRCVGDRDEFRRRRERERERRKEVSAREREKDQEISFSRNPPTGYKALPLVRYSESASVVLVLSPAAPHSAALKRRVFARAAARLPTRVGAIDGLKKETLDAILRAEEAILQECRMAGWMDER